MRNRDLSAHVFNRYTFYLALYSEINVPEVIKKCPIGHILMDFSYSEAVSKSTPEMDFTSEVLWFSVNLVLIGSPDALDFDKDFQKCLKFPRITVFQ